MTKAYIHVTTQFPPWHDEGEFCCTSASHNLSSTFAGPAFGIKKKEKGKNCSAPTLCKGRVPDTLVLRYNDGHRTVRSLLSRESFLCVFAKWVPLFFLPFPGGGHPGHERRGCSGQRPGVQSRPRVRRIDYTDRARPHCR